MKKTIDTNVEQFKIDYYDIQMKVKDIKQKLRELKKEIKPTAKAAYHLYERGDKTMYEKGKGGILKPKFKDLSRIMNDLDYWMGLDDEIQHMIKCC